MEMDILQYMTSPIWRNQQCHVNEEDRPTHLTKGRNGDIGVVHMAGDAELVPEN